MNQPSSSRPSDPAAPAVTLPVIAEELEVLREKVSTGAVRVRIEPMEAQTPVQLESISEEVDVERVAVGREVEARVEPWHEGDVLVVPVYEETVVLQRRIVLKEELRLRPRRERRAWEETVPLRRDRAQVERRQADGSWCAEDEAASQSGHDSASGIAAEPTASPPVIDSRRSST
jgi:uncharacterized protein (TIGR02271 family)